MNIMRREMQDIKNNSSFQSVGKSNMTTKFWSLLEHLLENVAVLPVTTILSRSGRGQSRSACGTADMCWSGARTTEQDQLRRNTVETACAVILGAHAGRVIVYVISSKEFRGFSLIWSECICLKKSISYVSHAEWVSRYVQIIA